MPNQMLEYWKRAPEDQIDLLFAHAPLLMFSVNQEMEVLRVSRFWAAKLGYSRAEMVGMKITDFASGPLDRQALELSYRVLPRREALEDTRLSFRDREGKDVIVELSTSGRYAPNGQLTEAMSIVFDKTEHVLAERAIAQNDAKNRFLAAMSHEIRTPMNAILGFAQLLRLGTLSDAQRSQANAIISSGNHLLRLLGDVLDLSRIEAGQMEIHNAPFELPDFIDDVMSMWQTSAREKELDLRCHLAPDLPQRISSDSGRLRQVLNNFLGNAIKFTQSGHVELLAETRSIQGGKAFLSFTVTDTGPGIAQSDLETLFEPFVQVNAERAVSRSGWGLGLSICRHLAELMNAEIQANSRPGEGTSFSFDLPVDLVDDPPQMPPKPAGASDEGAPSARLHVLVIEENLTNRELMAAILREMGHRTEGVDNGYEALRALRDATFDLILMGAAELNLKQIGGAEKIRTAGGVQRDIPIIAVTDPMARPIGPHLRAMGMNDTISKPIDIDVLRLKISTWAGKAGTGAQAHMSAPGSRYQWK